MPQIILYVDISFGGLHTHLFESTPDLGQLALGGVGSGITGNWNNIVSSFVIVSGKWKFFRDPNYQGLMGIEPSFGPGVYAWVLDWGIDNDAISSIRLVG